MEDRRTNKICIGNKTITLLYATLKDRKEIHNMDHEEKEIHDSIYHGPVKPTPFNEVADDEDIEFHKGYKNKSNYLLIEYGNKVIGAVSHSNNQGPIENMEIDITIRSTEYTGKGLGSQTILLLTDYLHDEYGIKAFIIRPSKINIRAIRAYEKSGFIKVENYNGKLYGDPDDYYGDYGLNGTENMVKSYL